MKLHLGCGRVYLKGYINIDGEADFIAGECDPAIVKAVAADPDVYYKADFGKLPNDIVVDLVHDLTEPLPYPRDSVDEVRMEQVLEHLPGYMAGNVVAEIFRILKPGGAFVIGVPDVKETAKQLAAAQTEKDEDWCIRLIHGTQRNSYSHHFCGYIPRTLKALLAEHGFSRFEDLPTINF